MCALDRSIKRGGGVIVVGNAAVGGLWSQCPPPPQGRRLGAAAPLAGREPYMVKTSNNAGLRRCNGQHFHYQLMTIVSMQQVQCEWRLDT